MSKATRPPVTKEARRKAVEQALAQLARTMEQLEIAVSSFPPNFDRESFGAAWYSRAPEERNRAMLVRWILEPEAVHAAVENQRLHLPAFIAALGKWVEGMLDR